MRSPDAVPVPIEELLRHRAWVQGLARTLVRDPAAANDLAQDAWVAALQRPPTRAHGVAGVRAWFGRVLRNRAVDRARARGRREIHEIAAGTRSVAPSAAETVAQAEVHRRVVDAVMRLEEPLRTAVVLRYFEGLPPREVARRTGVPAETARTRIGRGVERLRARLTGGDRRGRDALAAFAFAPLPTGVGTTGGGWGPAVAKGGVVALSVKQAVAVGLALAAAVGGVVLLPRAGASTAPQTPVVGEGGAEQARLAAQGRPPPLAASAEGTAGPTTPRAPVRLVVVREDGRAVGPTSLSIEAGGVLSPARPVGAEGAFDVEASDLARVAYVEAQDAALARFELPGGVARVELVLRTRSAIAGTVLVDGAAPAGPLVLGLRCAEPSIPAEALPVPHPFDPWSIAVSTDVRGAFRATGMPAGATASLSAPSGFVVEGPAAVRAPADGVVVRLRRLPHLHGRIVRGGSPLAGATASVPWEEGPSSGQVSATADAAGRFSLVLEGGAPRGTTLLLTDAQGLARAERTLPTDRGLDTDLGDLELEDPWAAVMRLEVVDEAGRPVASAVAAIPGDPSWKSAPSGADGRLRLPARLAHGTALVGALGHRIREVPLAPTGDVPARVVLETAALLRIRVAGLGPEEASAVVHVSGAGRIFDEPGSHAAVELREAVGGTHASTSVRAEDGDLAAFRLERGATELLVPWILPGRPVRVELRDAYGEGQHATEVRLERGEDRMLELRASTPARRIVGLVRDPAGAPIAGVQVLARAGTRPTREGDGLPGPLIVRRTDGSGRFTLDGVHGTALDLFVAAPGLCPFARRSVTLPVGERPLEVALVAGRTITARWRGAPPRGIDAWVEPTDPGTWAPGYRPFGGVLLEDGSIRFDGVPAEDVEVVVRTEVGEVRVPAPADVAEIVVERPKEK